jgi:hypothetical protein
MRLFVGDVYIWKNTDTMKQSGFYDLCHKSIKQNTVYFDKTN